MAPPLPALLGGPPERPQGPPSWPPADPEILDALQAAFHDGSWGKYHGSNCGRLEEALRAYHDTSCVLLCGSGTFAVELALRALNLEPGDEVLLAAYDYGGNFLCVHAIGAQPVLVDLDPANWNLSLERLREAFSPKVKAVIASHLHGGLVPMRELMDWAAKKEITVIEDAAQCPGALVQGRKAGTWGDLGILSFGGSKLLSAGRGGALLTNRPMLHQRARTYQLRGNLVCPLSELQAAVLLPQLQKLDERNALRLHHADLLRTHLAEVPGLVPFHNALEPDSKPGFYKMGFQYDAAQFGLPRDRFLAALRAEGMALDAGFVALHVGRSPKRYRAASDLTEAKRAHEGVVVLHHPLLLASEEDVLGLVRAIKKVWEHRDLMTRV